MILAGLSWKILLIYIHQQGSVDSIQFVSSVVLEYTMASLMSGLLAGTVLSLSLRSLLQGSWGMSAQHKQGECSKEDVKAASLFRPELGSWNRCHFQVRAGTEPTQVQGEGQKPHLSMGGVCPFHSHF